MAPSTASSPNVSAQSRTQSSQAHGRKSKHKSSRKRSASSPFASLFATLSSFSNSNNTTTVAPAIRSSSSVPRISNSVPSTSSGLRDRPSPRGQDDAIKKGMPSPKEASSKALVRRATTPAKQTAVSTRPTIKEAAPKSARPDVFSFQNGESRPPSPRPRNASSTSKIVSKQIRKSIDQEQVYPSPIPIRRVNLPSAGTSFEDSYSDSGLTTSETPSPPDTPSPSERRPIHTLPNASSSQDAVGRSIHPESFYRGKRRAQQTQKVDIPPEAPTAPHVQQMQPTSPSSHTIRASSFDHLSSPSNQQDYAKNMSITSPEASIDLNPNTMPDPYSMSPTTYTSTFQTQPSGFAAPQNPYPTPPINKMQANYQQRRPGYPQGLPPSQSGIDLRITPTRKPVGNTPKAKPSFEFDYHPRQYAQLTQQMIMRCESIINSLEGDLAHLDATTTGRDGSPGCWHRDQLVMRLTNAIIMHHRLLDTWSKISPLRKLTSLPTSPTTSAKLAAIESDIRHNMETYKNMHGFDVDSTIAHIVNDLVQVGDDASGAKAQGGTDRQSLAYLFGAILVLLLLEGGFGLRNALAGALILGLWRCAMC